MSVYTRNASAIERSAETCRKHPDPDDVMLALAVPGGGMVYRRVSSGLAESLMRRRGEGAS